MIEPMDKARLDYICGVLEDVLVEMADPNYPKDHDEKWYVERLSEIFSDGYRIQYSRVMLIVQKHSGEQGFSTYALSDMLGNVVDYLRDHYDEIEDRELFGKVMKLWDHVTIEIQRVQVNENINRMIEQTASNAEAKFKNLSHENRKVANESRRTLTKLRRSHSENMQILSIFAAIVVTFTGGMTFIGNSISSGDVVVFKTVALILFAGIVLGNVVFILLSVVMRIINAPYDIGERLSNLEWEHVRKSMIWFNILLVALIASDFIIWYFLGDFASTM